MARPPRDEGFERLFDAQFSRAQGIARRIVGNQALAEDLAAEAFARAFARWRLLRDDPGREGWVLRVTANLAIDSVRRRPAYLRPRPVVELQDEVAARVTLATALDILPPRQRTVVVLRLLADLSEAETADVLGISAGTVKAHLHRAVERLRHQMNPSDIEVTFATPRT